LKRIRPPQTWIEPSSEPSPSLVRLLNRMEDRRWQQETLEDAVQFIRECACEIKFILHLRQCGRCKLEVTLSIERYGGRDLPWFLDLINDVNELSEDPLYEGCPRVQAYRIGSYWDKSTDHNETLKFINDRITWAEKIIRQQILQAVRFYRRVKNWNLNESRPTSSTLPI